ncbi:MAG: PAS domain S-box protein [Candidatus Kryptoniota bacterium]
MSTQDYFKLMVESSLTPMYLIQDGLFRYVNSSFCRFSGYEAEEVVDRLGAADLAVPEDRELVAKKIRDRIEGRIPEIRYSFRALKKGGAGALIEVKASTIMYKGHPAIIGSVLDVTKRVLAENSLRESEDRYRHFFNEDVSAHYVTTPDGALLSCNEAFIKLFGFSSIEDVMRTNVSSLFIDPRNRGKFIDLVKERKRLEKIEAEYVRKDGKKVFVTETAEGEFDPDGSLMNIHGYLVDETNKRQLEAQLFEAQKMESIGTLVSGIAHDLNNVLAIILGHTCLIDPENVAPERMKRSREAISKATKRGANTIRQLLTFAHKVEIVTESMSVNEVIEEMLEFLKETFPEKIVFSSRLEPKLSTIHADPNQIQQVLINLCVNARDAMPEGGTLSISTSKVKGKVLNRRFSEVESGDYVLINVADTGTGIENKYISRIFEPFFTTKKDGRGTGLGLSVVYGIMKGHHGFVEVQSEVGKGTVFSLYLPIPLQVITTPSSTPKESIERGHGETIFVVEDEESIQDFMKAALEDNSYRVLLAKDGFEAVGVFGEHLGEVSLVIIDMGLPKMNGVKVLSEIKMIMPDVKIIFTSGYIEPDIKADIFEAGIKEFLPKPFSADDLLGKVQRVLNV